MSSRARSARAWPDAGGRGQDHIVEHPTGEFSVELETDPANPQNFTKAALLRTARLLMRGEAMVPASIWDWKAEREVSATVTHLNIHFEGTAR